MSSVSLFKRKCKIKRIERKRLGFEMEGRIGGRKVQFCRIVRPARATIYLPLFSFFLFKNKKQQQPFFNSYCINSESKHNSLS